MRQLISGLFGVLLIFAAAPFAAAADDAAPAIRSVIERQLQAFQEDDGSAAFSYASPMIQRQFGNAETFMAMVQRGYPSVYRPQTVEFRGLEFNGGFAVQEVFFVGPDGSAQLALYFMALQEDGSWKINGVRMTDAPDAII
ncbi:MAG: DUF4864 domain-containing protein [Rhodovibrionaceae bacterium]